MFDTYIFLTYIRTGLLFLLSFWWIYVPFFLYLILKDLWIKYKRDEYIQGLNWVLLEVVPPRDIMKTPQAMEHVFTSLHGVQTAIDLSEAAKTGKTQPWFSFEIASIAGKIHFYIRTLSNLRDLVESNIYAQYPEAEIEQVDDYTKNINLDSFKDGDNRLWGTELVFTKDNPYPILTYPFFNKDVAKEEQKIDPVASLLETIGKIGETEQVWIQILARPLADMWKVSEDVKDGWVIESSKKRDELMGREVKKPAPGLLGDIIKEIKAFADEIKNLLIHMVTGTVVKSSAGDSTPEKKEDNQPFSSKSSKMEQLVVSLIEEKMEKLGYDVVIRTTYFGHKDMYKDGVVSGILGSFKQFSGQHINGFIPNKDIDPEKALRDYMDRYLVQRSKYIPYLQSDFFYEQFPFLHEKYYPKSKAIVLNIEELASLYHFPSLVVKAPATPKVEAKKGEPPIGLPVQ